MQQPEVIYEATDRQAEFHAAPEMYKLYGGAMGGGKSVALCAEGIALSHDYPGNRGYICRHTLADFKRTTGLILKDMLERAGCIEKHHQTDHFYLMPNGSSIYYGGLGDDLRAIDKIKSMELGWFAIDEASETSEQYFLMLASRLRLKLMGIQYFGLLATNPSPGWIKHRFIDQKQSNHIFVPALPSDNPHLPEDYVERLMGVFPKEWQARFLEGDWSAFEGVSNIFPYAAIRAAINREPEQLTPVELGADIARFGDDEFVLARRSGWKVEIAQAILTCDLMKETGLIAESIRLHSPTKVKVDADGMGGGVVDRLRELGYEIIEVHGGGKPEDPQRFKNRKAEIYWGFRERLLAGTACLPDDLVLTAQLTSIEYKIDSSGRIEITSKSEMKKKGLKSPDRAEAVIYAFADMAQAGFAMFSQEAVY